MADGFERFDEQIEREASQLIADFRLYAAESYTLERNLKLIDGSAIVETLFLEPNRERSRNPIVTSHPLGNLTFRRIYPQEPIRQNELACARLEAKLVMGTLSRIIKYAENRNKRFQLPTDEALIVITGTDYFSRLTDPFGPLMPELKTYRTGDEQSLEWLAALEQ